MSSISLYYKRTTDYVARMLRRVATPRHVACQNHSEPVASPSLFPILPEPGHLGKLDGVEQWRRLPPHGMLAACRRDMPRRMDAGRGAR